MSTSSPSTGDAFSSHRLLADAIAALLAPLAEVAVHDLTSDTLAYIAAPMSPREVGEPSDLRELGVPGPHGFVGPYEKTNWDGRRLKSVSVQLPGEEPAMLCINVDVSRFEALRDVLGVILQPPAQATDAASMALLRNDWHESVNRHIANWTAERKLDARNLDREGRRALIKSLLQMGGFEAPRAAPYVANLLNLSRATIYNEISAIKKSIRPQ